MSAAFTDRAYPDGQDGDMELGGRTVPRYQFWHSYDHVYAEYVRRLADGTVGPGAQVANLEYLQRDPRYRIQVSATFERLDNECMIHNVEAGGFHLARMDHMYEEVPGGTRFQHVLYVPAVPMPVMGRWLVPVAWRPKDKGQQRIRHAIEEMGNLPNFLPQLYEHEDPGARREQAQPGVAASNPPNRRSRGCELGDHDQGASPRPRPPSESAHPSSR